MTSNQERLAARADVETARAELVDYLSQLEEAVNVPKRLARQVKRWRIRMVRFSKRQPLAAAGIVAAAISVLAGVAALLRKASR